MSPGAGAVIAEDMSLVREMPDIRSVSSHFRDWVRFWDSHRLLDHSGSPGRESVAFHAVGCKSDRVQISRRGLICLPPLLLVRSDISHWCQDCLDSQL